MNVKEQEKELLQAVGVLRATLRAIANRKAQSYEQEYLHRVRDMIDVEIKNNKEINHYLARHISGEVEAEITKD